MYCNCIVLNINNVKIEYEESNGIEGDVWFHRWRRLVSKYSGSMYDLPSGNISKEFVGLLADEIMMFSKIGILSGDSTT